MKYNYKSEFALELLPDVRLKETVKECNKCGVPVKGFYTAINILEQAGLILQIQKENKDRINSILNSLAKTRKSKFIISFEEKSNKEYIKIFANSFTKAKIFTIVKESVKKKIQVSALSTTFQEIIKMHEKLKEEDISHQIQYSSGIFFDTIVIQNIDSYFEFGVDRIEKIFSSCLWESSDDTNNKKFRYFTKDKNKMQKKIKRLNDMLCKEFNWQEEQLEELSKKYRKVE